MTEHEPSHSSLSETQESVLQWLPILPAVCSLMSSCILMRLMIQAKFKTPYRRFLLALGVFDALNTIRIVLGGFPGLVNCKLFGAWAQLTVPVYGYYGCLSVYFLLRIRFGMTDRVFAKRIEPWMHAIVILHAVVTAAVGLWLDLFRENRFGSGCWIGPNPTVGCGPACALKLQWMFTASIYLAVFPLILINNIAISNHVIGNMKRVKRFDFEQNCQGSKSAFERSSSQQLYQQQQHSNIAFQHNSVSCNFSSELQIQQQGERQQKHRLRRCAGRGRPHKSPNEQASSSVSSQDQRVQQVVTQATLYVCVYYLVFGWTLVIRVMGMAGYDNRRDQHKFYTLMIGKAIFHPMLGLGNLFLYIRPRYLLQREKSPKSQSRTEILLAVMGLSTNNNNHSVDHSSASGPKSPAVRQQQQQQQQGGNVVKGQLATAAVAEERVTVGALTKRSSNRFCYSSCWKRCLFSSSSSDSNDDHDNNNNNNSPIHSYRTPPPPPMSLLQVVLENNSEIGIPPIHSVPEEKSAETKNNPFSCTDDPEEEERVLPNPQQQQPPPQTEWVNNSTLDAGGNVDTTAPMLPAASSGPTSVCSPAVKEDVGVDNPSCLPLSARSSSSSNSSCGCPVESVGAAEPITFDNTDDRDLEVGGEQGNETMEEETEEGDGCLEDDNDDNEEEEEEDVMINYDSAANALTDELDDLTESLACYWPNPSTITYHGDTDDHTTDAARFHHNDDDDEDEEEQTIHFSCYSSSRSER